MAQVPATFNQEKVKEVTNFPKTEVYYWFRVNVIAFWVIIILIFLLLVLIVTELTIFLSAMY